MGKKDQLENDYERMVPEFHKESLIYAEHYTRYYVAEDIVEGKVVLDIASGSGYGTNMLAKKAKYVYGVDVNEIAINYSKKNFGAKNIEFLVGDGVKIPLDDNSVDVVTTFETIEHIEDYHTFIKEVKRVLRPDGVAIVSTPNELEFAEGNHFHLHEFEYDELVDLLKQDFKQIKSYFQSTWKYVAVDSAENLESKGPVGIELMNLSNKKSNEHLYFYLLCSNREITEGIKPVAALGEHYSDRQLMLKDAQHNERHEKDNHQINLLHQQIQEHKELVKAEHERSTVLEKQITDILSSKTYKGIAKIKAIKNLINKK